MSTDYDSKDAIRRHVIVTSLPYHRKAVAHGLIDRGASLALIYFWYNMLHGHYNHVPVSVVMEHTADYMAKYPAFENDITTWFQHYEQQIRDEKNNSTH